MSAVERSRNRMEGKKPQTLVSHRNGPVTLCDLPPELVGMVFWHIDSYYEALFLALTCTYMWQCGEHDIKLNYENFVSPSYGHRIITLGTWAEDLPDKMCQPHEVQAMVRAMQLDYEKWDKNRLYDKDWEPKGFSSWDAPAQRVFHLVREILFKRALRSALFLTLYGQFSDSDWDISGAKARLYTEENDAPFFDISDAEDWTRSLFRLYKERGDVMVLRNRSKLVYVRSDTFAIDGNDQDPTWGFGRLVAYHTMWTSASSGVHMKSLEKLRRGMWAGDVLSVVPLAMHEDVTWTPESGWKDVTQEMKERLVAIKELWV